MREALPFITPLRRHALASTITEFVKAHHSEIIQVRKDFLEKEPGTFICGCATWETYVVERLNCSLSHMRRLLGEDNPATPIHDGSANRQPPTPKTVAGPPTAPGPAPTSTTGATFEIPDEPEAEPEVDIESLAGEEYIVALVEQGLKNLALVIARKVKMHGIPAKFFVYGDGGMDRNKGKQLRDEREQAALDYVPEVYDRIAAAVKRLR